MSDFPDVPLDDPATWWLGHISGATIKSNLIDLLNNIVARLADQGEVTSGILAGANGCSITTQRGHIIGNVAWLRCIYTLGSAAVTSLGSPGTSGHLTNTTVLTVADSAFVTAATFSDQALPSGSGGRTASHVMTSASVVELCSVAGAAALTAGDTFSFFGPYLLT